MSKINKIQKHIQPHWLLYPIMVLTLYAAIIASIDHFAVPKIGYINSSVLLEKYEGAVAARKQLDAEGEKWQANIKTLETELASLNKTFVEENAKWGKKARTEKQAELQKKQDEYVRYKRAVTEKAAKLEQELLQNVYAELNAQVESFGKRNGHQMILGTVAGGNILYAQQAVDLTEAFLAYVKEQG